MRWEGAERDLCFRLPCFSVLASAFLHSAEIEEGKANNEGEGEVRWGGGEHDDGAREGMRGGEGEVEGRVSAENKVQGRRAEGAR